MIHYDWGPKRGELTIVALCNAILYSASFGEVRYLGPVFVGVGTRTECTAGTVCGGVLFGR